MDADIEFIFQEEPRGLARIILVAEEFLVDEEFVMNLGDKITKGSITQHVQKFKSLDPEALVSLTRVDDPQRFGVAEFYGAGKVKRLVEKPKVPPSNFALARIHFFKPAIIEACKSINGEHARRPPSELRRLIRGGGWDSEAFDRHETMLQIT